MQASNPDPEKVKGKSCKKHAIAAAVFSFLVPGLGHAYLGKLTLAVAFALPVPLCFVLVSRTELLDRFAGVVGWMFFHLCLMVAGSIFAYRTGANAASDGPSSNIPGMRRFGYVLAFLVCMGVVSQFALAATTTRAFKIVASSMEPTIIKGDRLMADMRFYSHHSIQRGDVAVVASPVGGELFVKRISALGGDSIKGVDGRIYVNGTLQQQYASFNTRNFQIPNYLVNFGPLSVPPGKVFLLGDNLSGSWDSRSPEFGLVDVQSVKGKVLYLYWSTDKTRIGKKVN